jgi:glyoxylase-like metal-dependent hydrolase (beta-lactamase superfamily II)
MDGVRYAAGPDTVTLWFDWRSGLLTVVETLEDDPILGDRRGVSWLTRWQPAGGGVLLPRQADQYANDRLQVHTVFTAVTVNPDLPDSLFAIPDSIRARAQPATMPPPAVSVTLAELAPGVWRAEGGSHHSLVVEQGNALVVVEAPQSATRFQAVLDTLRSRFPDKRVRLVVNTHHHWDHSGGLRTALAAGLPVLTHARNAAFVRGIGTAAKTVAPDTLSRTRRVPAVQVVADSVVVGRGDGRVVVYALATAHVEGMLAAFVPGAGVLFTSDIFAPGTPAAAAGGALLVDFARAHGLTVRTVAGGHGAAAPWADVERAAATRP